MMVEYEITLGDQRLKIKQRVEQGTASVDPTNALPDQTILLYNYAEDRLSKSQKPTGKTAAAGGGPGDPLNAGGSPPFAYGSGPVTLIGPFLMICPCCEHGRVDDARELKTEERTHAKNL